MAVIFALLFLGLVGYAIKQYHEGNKHKGVLVYFFFISHGFYLIPDDVISGLPINKLVDFGTIYALYVCAGKLFHHSRSFKLYLQRSPEIKLFGILFLYLSVAFLWTVLFEVEIFSMSLAMYRNEFRFLSFIIFADLNLHQLKWVFKKVFTITAVACVLYVIQPLIGIKTLTGGGVGEAGSSGLARYRNIPYLAYFFLIYATIKLRISSIKSVLLLMLFAVSLVLTQHRGIMLGYVMSIACYLLLERKVKKAVQYSIIGGILLLTVGQFVLERFEKADTGSDFKALANLDYKKVDYGNDDEGGTLTFRVLLLMERFNYLVEHPQYFLQGVGMRHEDSPYTQRDFAFNICARKRVSAGWYYQQLDTGDLVWATPLIKYGGVGFIFYIIITLYMTRFFYRNREMCLLATIAFYYYLLLIFISFKNDQLFDSIHLFMIFLLYHFIIKQKIHNFKIRKDENIHPHIFERRQ